MPLIDTHAHLFLEQFQTDLPEVIQRAADAGVEQFILPNVDASTIDDLTNVALQYGNCRVALGLHPTSVRENWQTETEQILARAPEWHPIAVGEIGIDLYWDKTTLGIQTEAFVYQLQWAARHDLPVIIHSREAFGALFDIFERYGTFGVRGVFHSFTGTAAEAQRIIDYGFVLGIGGVVTFKNSGLPEVLKAIPLRHIVLETDAPYLAPTPHRGKRNEPAYLTLIAGRLAEIYPLTAEEIADRTTENAKKLFKI